MVELIQISLLNIVAKLLKFGFELGTSFFVSKDTYGEFALILSYILIFTKISSFGIQNIMVRDVPKYSSLNYISYLFFNSTITIFSIGVVLYFILYSISFNYILLYPVIFIVYFINSLIILYSTYLRSIKEVKLWIYFQDIQIYLIYFTILATVYIFQNGNLSIESILNIYTVATTISFLSLLIFIKYKRGLDIVSKISIQKIKYIASQSLPVLFTGLTYLIISRIDIIMLEKYVDLKIVGEYNIVARVTFQVLFFNQVIISYYYPRLSQKFAKKESYINIAKYNTKFLLLSLISVVVATYLLYRAIIDFNLFDILKISHRDELFNVFMVLSITQIIYSAISFYGNILIYIHKQKMEYLNNLLVLILAVITNLILIPKYGVLGASIATSISLLLGNVLQMAQVKYFTKTLFISIRR
jgi:O-antigen/teichoic acid export membrane protein